MTAEAAWDYAIGMIKVDGLEPTEDFKKYIELEKSGQATTEDLKKYLRIRKHWMMLRRTMFLSA